MTDSIRRKSIGSRRNGTTCRLSFIGIKVTKHYQTWKKQIAAWRAKTFSKSLSLCFIWCGWRMRSSVCDRNTSVVIWLSVVLTEVLETRSPCRALRPLGLDRLQILHDCVFQMQGFHYYCCLVQSTKRTSILSHHKKLLRIIEALWPYISTLDMNDSYCSHRSG